MEKGRITHNHEGRHRHERGGGRGGIGPKDNNVIGILKDSGDGCVCVCEYWCGRGFRRSRRGHHERKRQTLHSSMCRQKGGEGWCDEMEPEPSLRAPQSRVEHSTS
jgi:hypothetical protein